MSAPPSLKVGRTSSGYCIRVEGRGTSREGRAVEEFARGVAAGGAYTLVLDLSACEYLDSTFLGEILGLQRHSASATPAFAILNPSPRCRQLFKDMRIESLLTILSEAPTLIGECESIPEASMDPREVARHMMECHRRLAEMGGPLQQTFNRIADQFQQELGAS
jgi:anti-anti-sigma regulatory factor